MRRNAGIHYLCVCCFIALAAVAPGAFSAPAINKEEPIKIEADRAKIDEKQGISTYSGHVVLSQGNMQINADKLIVHHVEGRLSHITAVGKPVRFDQSSSSEQQGIHGEAMTMEFFAAEERLLLLEKALLSQGGNTFSGNRIEYDTKREVVTAGVSPTGKERVQVTIQPQSLEQPQSPDAESGAPNGEEDTSP
jgi:lipopolysaccharide export system protein LptA